MDNLSILSFIGIIVMILNAPLKNICLEIVLKDLLVKFDHAVTTCLSTDFISATLYSFDTTTTVFIEHTDKMLKFFDKNEDVTRTSWTGIINTVYQIHGCVMDMPVCNFLIARTQK